MRNAQKNPTAWRTAGKDVISGCFFCRSLRLFFVQFFQYFSAVLLDHPRHKLGAALHVQGSLFFCVHACVDQFPSFHEFPASPAAGISPALFSHVTGKEKTVIFTLPPKITKRNPSAHFSNILYCRALHHVRCADQS